MSQFRFEADVLPVVEHWARKRFANDPQRDEKIADAKSVAWEFTEAARDRDAATPSTIARFAVWRVAQGRQFPESVRSIDGPPGRCPKPLRVEFRPDRLCTDRDDPAERAGFQIDFSAWFAGMDDRKKILLESLALGNSTCEVADGYGLTPGRVSQIRLEFAESWQAFTA